MIFMLVFDITSKNKIVCKVLKTLSRATFAGYLLSYCFDQWLYRTYVVKYTTMPDRCAHAWLIVLEVFGLSMVSGLILQGLYDLGEKGVRKITAKVREIKEMEEKEAGLLPNEPSEPSDPPQQS